MFLKRFVLLIILLTYGASISYGEDPSDYRIKYLDSFNAILSGQPIGYIDKIVTDPSNEEVYLLDSYNGRIVVVDTLGIFLYEFNYYIEGVKGSVLSFDIDSKTGDIYVATALEIYVLNFRGKLKSKIFSSASHKEVAPFGIQDIDFARTDDGPKIFIGDNRQGRMFSINPDGSGLIVISSDDVYIQNYKSLVFVDDSFVILDSSRFTVVRIDKEGNFLHSFGKLSSLLGGFSMPVKLTVDARSRRIFVVDTNRSMLICFDWNGKPLFEIGGPDIFKSPRSIAIDDEGRMYVGDASGFIRVFQIIDAPLEMINSDSLGSDYSESIDNYSEDTISGDTLVNDGDETPSFTDETVPEPGSEEMDVDDSDDLQEGESGFIDDLNVDDEPSFEDEI